AGAKILIQKDSLFLRTQRLAVNFLDCGFSLETTMPAKTRTRFSRFFCTLLSVLYLGSTAQSAAGYAFNQLVPDVRQSVAFSGGSACPVRAHQLSAPSSISFRWSTTLGANPV